MQLINKSVIIRCIIYITLTLSAYWVGLIKGKPLYYNAGQLSGCTKGTRMFSTDLVGFRCVINRYNQLLLEATDGIHFKYTLLDELHD